MWSVPSRIASALATTLALILLLGGCGDMPKDEARNEVHQRVDKIADRIGTNPTVRSEGAAGMDPEASTLGYSYIVRVDVDPEEALDKLRGPIADDMRDNGWTVDYDHDLSMVTFHHEDGRVFAITVSFKHNYVNIIGETPFKNPDS